jgi:hypothetical protein
MKKYIGSRDSNGDADVFVIDEHHEAKPLDLGLKYVQHSPTGFAWGYLGSGPAQLAFAILLDYFGDPARAQSLYQQFKFAVIADLPMDEPWEITSDEISTIFNTIGARLHIREASCRDIT